MAVDSVAAKKSPEPVETKKVSPPKESSNDIQAPKKQDDAAQVSISAGQSQDAQPQDNSSVPSPSESSNSEDSSNSDSLAVA